MKTLMMLGAGPYQIPGIKKAQEKGYKVIACSYNADDKGMFIANYAETIDITDKEKILAAAKKHKINGIMTMCSDVGVPTVGYVNDQLELAGPSLESAILCADKLKMKESFIQHRVNTAAFRKVKTPEEAIKTLDTLRGKVVCKATDSSGSRGIVKAFHKEDIAKAFEESMSYTKKGYIIIEEFISGEEFGSQALVLDKKLVYNFCHNDDVTCGTISTPIGHSYPFRGDPEIEKKAWLEVEKTVEALGIENAQLNCDFILHNNEVYILEIGCRMGATSLPQLTENFTGIDWIGQGIDLAMGILNTETFLPAKIKKQPTASTLLYSLKTGTVQKIEIPSWSESAKDISFFTLDIELEDHVNLFKLGPDRIGEIVFTAATLPLAEARVKQFLEDFKLHVI